MKPLRLLAFAALALAGAISYEPAAAQSPIPCAWNYSIINGQAVASYCGNVQSAGGMNVVATSIAAMEALPSPVSASAVIVTGAQAGSFIYNSSPCNNGGLGDSGTQFPATVGGGCWLRQYNGSALQAQWFAGSDLGAQVNAAVAAFGYQAAGNCGEIDLPAGVSNFSTPIVINYGAYGTACWLKGQGRGAAGGSVLHFTGTSGFAINFNSIGQSGGAPYLSGKVSDFTLTGMNVSTNCASGIIVQAENGFVARDIEVSSFLGANAGCGNFNSPALEMSNGNVAAGQNEAFNVDIAATNDAAGVLLLNGGSTNHSYEHARLAVYYTGAGSALALSQGAYLARGELYINGDLNSGGAEVFIDPTSTLTNEHVFLGAEVISGTAYTYSVQTGGGCNLISGFTWSDGGNLTTNGTCQVSGDIDGNGTWQTGTLRVSNFLTSPTTTSVPNATATAITNGTGGGSQEDQVQCSSGANGFSEIVPMVPFTSVGTAFGVITYGTVPARTYSFSGASLTLSIASGGPWSCKVVEIGG